MSRRPASEKPQAQYTGGQLVDELERLRTENSQLRAAASCNFPLSAPCDGICDLNSTYRAAAAEFDKLEPVEKSAASLGLSENSWQPIKEFNDAHYGELLRQNRLDSDLARRIEAYKVVSGGGKDTVPTEVS